MEHIDLYCERISPSFWAEPANAISNASFVLAAIWATVEMIRRSRTDWPLMILILLAASIGVGSFLFHTFANLWTSFADVIPIWTFIAAYVVVSVIRLSGANAHRVVLISFVAAVIMSTLVWLSVSGAATDDGSSHDIFNGSIQYTPALIAVIVFAVILTLRRNIIAHWIVAAASAFTLALVFRTIDLAICPVFPMGTHFLWHLGNGLMVALLLQGLIRVPSSSRAAEPS